MNTNIAKIQANLVNAAALVTNAADKLHTAYTETRVALVGDKKGKKAARLVWDTIKGWLVDSEEVNYETARTLIQAWMRADGLRQRSGGSDENARMDKGRRDLVKRLIAWLDEQPETKEWDAAEKSNLLQSAGRQIKKSAKAAK